MMAIAILLPVVAGFFILAVRNYYARNVVVVVTALILIGNSILLSLRGPFTYTPSGFNWGFLITILDYAILIFYLSNDLNFFRTVIIRINAYHDLSRIIFPKTAELLRIQAAVVWHYTSLNESAKVRWRTN